MPKQFVLKLKEYPIDTRTQHPITDIRKIPREFVEFRPNVIFYDRLEFVPKNSDVFYASKSLSLRSVSDGTMYRLSYFWLLKTFKMCVIDHGVIEGYWAHSRLTGFYYGIRPIAEEDAPRRLVKKVTEKKYEEQIRGQAGRGVRFPGGAGEILLPPRTTKSGYN